MTALGDAESVCWMQEDLNKYIRERVSYDPGGRLWRVAAHPRVHFGAIDLTADTPRGGGFGFVIRSITAHVTCCKGDNVEKSLGQFVEIEDVHEYARRLGVHTEGLTWSVSGKVLQHKGFGSTTQLTIAALQSAALYSRRAAFSPRELARVGVASTSSVGLRCAFDRDAVLDIGAQASSISVRIPRPRYFRLRFPERWKVMAAWPTNESGFSGSDEEDFWGKVIPASTSSRGEVAAALLLEIMPAILDNDPAQYQHGVALLNRSEVKSAEWETQSPEVLAIAETIRDEHLEPLLTSVGPGLVVVTNDEARIRRAMRAITENFNGWQAHLGDLSQDGSAAERK